MATVTEWVLLLSRNPVCFSLANLCAFTVWAWVCVCTESPVLERLQREEKVCVCVSEHCHSSLANRTCIRAHRGLVVGKLLTHEHAKTHRHTGARTHIVRSQLSTPASQLIKPNPRDWTEEFKWELPCPPPLKFCPFQLTVAGAALVASNRYNTPTFSVLLHKYSVLPLLHLWASHRLFELTLMALFAWTLTLGSLKPWNRICVNPTKIPHPTLPPSPCLSVPCSSRSPRKLDNSNV